MKPKTKNIIFNLVILGSAIIALTSGWKFD
ncbi:hypothetical protein JOC75_004347 [Metabacillus crassostreae]|nr:hypothetical protein [Metabacillus crassostreae]